MDEAKVKEESNEKQVTGSSDQLPVSDVSLRT